MHLQQQQQQQQFIAKRSSPSTEAARKRVLPLVGDVVSLAAASAVSAATAKRQREEQLPPTATVKQTSSPKRLRMSEDTAARMEEDGDEEKSTHVTPPEGTSLALSSLQTLQALQDENAKLKQQVTTQDAKLSMFSDLVEFVKDTCGHCGDPLLDRPRLFSTCPCHKPIGTCCQGEWLAQCVTLAETGGQLLDSIGLASGLLSLIALPSEELVQWKMEYRPAIHPSFSLVFDTIYPCCKRKLTTALPTEPYDLCPITLLDLAEDSKEAKVLSDAHADDRSFAACVQCNTSRSTMVDVARHDLFQCKKFKMRCPLCNSVGALTMDMKPSKESRAWLSAEDFQERYMAALALHLRTCGAEVECRRCGKEHAVNEHWKEDELVAIVGQLMQYEDILHWGTVSVSVLQEDVLEPWLKMLVAGTEHTSEVKRIQTTVMAALRLADKLTGKFTPAVTSTVPLLIPPTDPVPTTLLATTAAAPAALLLTAAPLPTSVQPSVQPAVSSAALWQSTTTAARQSQSAQANSSVRTPLIAPASPAAARVQTMVRGHRLFVMPAADTPPSILAGVGRRLSFLHSSPNRTAAAATTAAANRAPTTPLSFPRRPAAAAAATNTTAMIRKATPLHLKQSSSVSTAERVLTKQLSTALRDFGRLLLHGRLNESVNYGGKNWSRVNRFLSFIRVFLALTHPRLSAVASAASPTSLAAANNSHPTPSATACSSSSSFLSSSAPSLANSSSRSATTTTNTPLLSPIITDSEYTAPPGLARQRALIHRAHMLLEQLTLKHEDRAGGYKSRPTGINSSSNSSSNPSEEEDDDDDRDASTARGRLFAFLGSVVGNGPIRFATSSPFS